MSTEVAWGCIFLKTRGVKFGESKRLPLKLWPKECRAGIRCRGSRGVASLNESIREVATQGQNLQQYVDKVKQNVATLEKVVVQLTVERDLVNGKLLQLKKISGDKQAVVKG